MHRRSFLFASAGVVVFPSVVGGCLAQTDANFASADSASTGHSTNWHVQSSIGLDACFALTIAAAPVGTLQVQENLDRRDNLRSILGPRGVEAADAFVGALIRASGTTTPGPQIAFVASAGPLGTIEDLIDTFTIEGVLEEGLREVPSFASEQARSNLSRIRPLAANALRAVLDSSFKEYWKDEFALELERRGEELQFELMSKDIFSQLTRYLNREFKPSVTVFLSTLSEPHGIKLLGQQFVTSSRYETATICRNAVHESIHQLFVVSREESQRILGRLEQDELLLSIARNADRSYGYTSSDGDIVGIVEEGAVQALEAIINENIGIPRNQAIYWQNQDGGMHVFAAGTYALLKDSRFAVEGGDFLQWLDVQTSSGFLQGENLQRLAASVVGEDLVDRWL